MHEIRPVGERPHEGDGEPVAGRLADPGLVLHVVRQMRERVALGVSTLVGDLLVPPRERDRLERQEADLLGVVEREQSRVRERDRARELTP